jgi:hypothetical protein
VFFLWIKYAAIILDQGENSWNQVLFFIQKSRADLFEHVISLFKIDKKFKQTAVSACFRFRLSQNFDAIPRNYAYFFYYRLKSQFLN